MTCEDCGDPAPPPARKRAGGDIKALYRRAFDDNLTGMAGMVAYNLLLSVFPLALLALFIAGQVLQSGSLQDSVLEDLQRLFPTAAESTLANLLNRISTSTTGLGILALVASVWIGSSFWGALDTAFCQIYHLDCRSWLRQKRFALLMLVFSLLFIAATVAIPVLQSIVVEGAEDLPLGLSEVEGLVYAATLAGGIGVLFLVLSIIYWSVPAARVPWRAVWPGALAATIAISIVDYAFPAYLSSISTLAGLGTSLIFIVIVLVWFYVLAIIVLAGAEINALRFERTEGRTGESSAQSAAEPEDEKAPTGTAAAEPAGNGASPPHPPRADEAADDGGQGKPAAASKWRS